MPGEPTLPVVVALRDQFTAGFQAIVKQIELASAKMNRAFLPMTTALGTAKTSLKDTATQMAAVGTATDRAMKTSTPKVVGLDTELKRVSHTMFSLRNVFVGILGGVVIKGLSETMARSEDAEIAFKNFTKSAGIDATKALEAMRTGMRGTINDTELMIYANNMLGQGIIQSVKDFEIYSEAARRLGKSQGRDLAESMERLTYGIARMSNNRLEELTLVTSAKDAYQKYADSVGKSASNLTVEEKRLAFSLSVKEKISKRLKELGDDTLSTSEQFARLGVKGHVALQLLASGLKPSFVSLTRDLTKAIQENAEAFRDFGKAMGGILTGMADIISNFYKLGQELSDLYPLVKLITESKGVGESAQAAGILSARMYSRHFYPRMTREELLGEQKRLQANRDAWPIISFGPENTARFAQLNEQQRLVQEYITNGELSIGGPVERPTRRGTTSKPPPFPFVENWPDVGFRGMSLAESREKFHRDEMELLSDHAEMASGLDKIWESINIGVKNYTYNLGTTVDQISTAINDSLTGLQSNMSDLLFNTMMGKMGKFKDYVRAWAKDITRAISDMFSKQLISAVFNVIGGTIGSAASAAAPFATIPGVMGGEGTPGFAGGIPMHAEGGLFTRPHLGVVGDVPEAVIPLKNGKVPIEGGGSRNVNVNFSISAMDGPSVKRVLYEERRFIENLVKNAIRDDRDMRGTLRKV